MVKVSEAISGKIFEFERTEQPPRKLEDTKQWLVEQTSCNRQSEKIIS